MTVEELLETISLGETSAVQFKEAFYEILRLFQESGAVYADEMIVPDTGEADIDKEKIEEYLSQLSSSLGDRPTILNKQLYHNLRIMKKDQPTLGGLLFFGKNPQQFRPAFGIAAISFFGNSIDFIPAWHR
ncbi:hypothetical protein FACS1894137_09420 [Spirochaetia bacterium]|nr:hypothetical protein FACS1894137_09420 [Spirochaetia bacterium]